MIIMSRNSMGTTQFFLEQGAKVFPPVCIAFKTVLDGICYILYSLIATVVYAHFHAVDSRYIDTLACALHMPAWEGMGVVG